MSTSHFLVVDSLLFIGKSLLQSRHLGLKTSLLQDPNIQTQRPGHPARCSIKSTQYRPQLVDTDLIFHHSSSFSPYLLSSSASYQIKSSFQVDGHQKWSVPTWTRSVPTWTFTSKAYFLFMFRLLSYIYCHPKPQNQIGANLAL